MLKHLFSICNINLRVSIPPLPVFSVHYWNYILYMFFMWIRRTLQLFFFVMGNVMRVRWSYDCTEAWKYFSWRSSPVFLSCRREDFKAVSRHWRQLLVMTIRRVSLRSKHFVISPWCRAELCRCLGVLLPFVSFESLRLESRSPWVAIHLRSLRSLNTPPQLAAFRAMATASPGKSQGNATGAIK